MLKTDESDQISSHSLGSTLSAAGTTFRPLPAEGWLVVVVCLLFVVVNLATATLSPIVWTDEVFFADPAYQLAYGNGFRSGIWVQPAGQFFADNVPAYSVILAGWMRVFGFNPTAVRSINYVLTALVVGLVWWGVRRFDIIRSPRLRLFMTMVLLCGYEMGISYRSGRYDMLGTLLCVVGFLGLLHPKPVIGYAIALLVGLVMPVTGLQLVPYAGIMGLIAALFIGWRRAIPYLVYFGVGAVIGLVGLFALYRANGLMEYFTSAVLHLSKTGSPGAGVNGLKTRIGIVFKLPRDHPTLVVETFLLIGLFVVAKARGLARFRSPLGFGLTVALLIPALVGALYNFPRYYGWMVDVPVTVAILAVLDELRLPKLAQLAALGGLAVVLVIGLPMRLALALNERDARDYKRIEAFVERNLTSSDHVLIDDAPFYPARRIAAELAGQAHVHSLSDAERAAINVMIIIPGHDRGYQEAVGGTWRLVDELKPLDARGMGSIRHGADLENYHLLVFRRTQSP